MLLDRDTFREKVLERDNQKCVVCKRQATSAHHILERRLFDDGGYYLDNGVSLCDEHHIQAEKTELSCEYLRELAQITNIVIPEHFFQDTKYDKWGNIVLPNGTRLKGELFFTEQCQKILKDSSVIRDFVEYVKYPRTYHSHISRGTTSDDRFMPSGYVQIFSQMPELVLTEKIDGQNVCFKKEGVFARSHTSSTNHPWDKPMRERWELIKNELENIELFGESMFAIHSIEYKKLESYFYLFAIRKDDIWLSWDEVQFYANYFDFPTVPEIKLSINLKDCYRNDIDENELFSNWLTKNLKMNWADYVNTGGFLEGFDPIEKKSCCEGFVLRNKNEYRINHNNILKVEPNGFDSVLKIVREKHVKTNQHWTKTWKIAKLIDYQKFGWSNYRYLEKIS